MDLLTPPRLSRTSMATPRARKVPAPKRLALRGAIIRGAKWALPGAAVLLLLAVALWPELTRLTSQERLIARHLLDVDSARMLAPHYRGVDERGRPYTITAESASQSGPQRVDLILPKADIVMEGGAWVYTQSQAGAYIQHAGQLDLSGDVLLYRSDGMTLHTDSAAIEMKAGAVASNALTHVEGPFGTIDSLGFVLLDRGAVIQFTGPAHMIVNQTR